MNSTFENNENIDNNTSSERKTLKHWQWVSIYLMAYDTVAVTLSYFLALMLRFDFRYSMIPVEYLEPWKHFALIYVVICLLVFWRSKLYKSIWRFASFTELQRITLATAVTGGLHIILITLLFKRMPLSYYFGGMLIQFIMIVAIRFSYRFVLLLRASHTKNNADRVMMVGAGAAGQMLLRDLRRTKLTDEQVVCFIDDNPNKWHSEIDGVPVAGGRESIVETAIAMNIDKIYIALPSISAKERKKIIDICRQTDCEVMNLPGMYQLALGEVTVESLKKVDVEDLLGREPVKMSSRELRDYLRDKVVLITGGGGSIGSELCRQVAATPGVKQLIIFDIYENNAHAIKLELSDKYPDLDLVTLIGSVRNSHKVNQVFEDYRPNIVLHAAAHKHVPLMEDSPCEAIKNNVLGTYNVAYAAMKYGCAKFVLISTDKAVNPVNVMGASKRMCEMIIQAFARKIEEGRADELPELKPGGEFAFCKLSAEPTTEYVAVRFGNVLGSNGSVIPRFREQIANGGPVTVTHPDIVRYFMTIPEAAALVLTATTLGGGGRIFVLDMGTAVKIDELARNMIRLSGLKPDEDIQIVYTGLRPGEKLYEERLMDEEGLTKTSNDLINIGQPIPFDEDQFLRRLPELAKAAYEDRDDIRDMITEFVPTYHPAGEQGTLEKTEAYVEQIKEILEKKVQSL